VKEFVSLGRDKVLFGQKLERIGDQGVDQTETGET